MPCCWNDRGITQPQIPCVWDAYAWVVGLGGGLAWERAETHDPRTWDYPRRGLSWGADMAREGSGEGREGGVEGGGVLG